MQRPWRGQPIRPDGGVSPVRKMPFFVHDRVRAHNLNRTGEEI